MLSTLAQSTAAKCPMIAAEKITTGTHMAPDMGIRSGSLNTKSHRAQRTNATSTRLPPSSGITAARNAFSPDAKMSG